MRKTVVINVVGLTARNLQSTKGIALWAAKGKVANINAVTPAVTCTAQATYLTGVLPEKHGIVSNGWYFRDECEVKFWRQSNHLVQSEKIWEAARKRDPKFTCANLFWWYNMYSSVDYSITPRPMYPADGRKIPDIYTQPSNLREELNEKLGTFPLFDFWGPRTSIRSSEWIAESAKLVEEKFDPTLTLIYLPHLDYNLQRLGPSNSLVEKDFSEIDRVCTELIQFYEQRGANVILLSEYGITRVTRPVNINQALRQAGLIEVREELGLELLDAGASRAFAVADHQLAHVYVNDRSEINRVRKILEEIDGIESILDEEGKNHYGLNHPRSGELVAISRPDAWFTYYYWLDENRAPDFARTVDIHRKPGYDPVELFIDPEITFPKLRVASLLLKKSLGFRYLMDVISLDPSLVKGSHGRVTDDPADGPLFITKQSNLLFNDRIDAIQVFGLLMNHLLI
jgi:predicted AlkP superfamily pyrophosphatase or phosphodiesterase